MLNTMGIFRPKLAVCGDVARLALEASDLTCDRRAACVAVQARSSPAILTSPNVSASGALGAAAETVGNAVRVGAGGSGSVTYTAAC